ncbi:hypothetical protein [Streptomyces sp. NPDC091268]|uniref:hypothetical protein n=1 Tax=Streptomyces sp. NPDC091268 TaxID=3365979 RepID=UPI003813F810
MVTSFEGYPHEALSAMVDGLDPAAVEARAARLTQAAAVITEIGEALKRRELRCGEGEAARALCDWADRTGSATLRLAEYAAVGGAWLGRAAQAMYEARGAGGVPAYDPAEAAALRAHLEAARTAPGDPAVQHRADASGRRLAEDRQRAADGLRRLAEAYELSAAGLRGVEADPPAFPALPGACAGVGDAVGVGAGAGRQVFRGGGGGESRGPVAEAAEAPVAPVGGARGSVAASRAGAEEGVVRLDGAVAVTGELRGATPTAPAHPGLPAHPGSGVGGMAGVAGLAGLAGIPVRDTGITGGRPMPSGHGGRTPDPGAGTGTGRGTGAGTGRSTGTARGVVIGEEEPRTGGRPAATASPAAGRPFTQGGSGLVRGPGGGAHLPGRRPGTAPRAAAGPGHLTEDEETWQTGRGLVPPVIDC